MCNDKHLTNKRGTSLKDGKLHQEDHEQWTRRSFIRTLGMAGGGAMALGGLNVNALAANASLPLLLNGGVDDRILIIIRLAGGNDGLNTVVPLHDYGTYQDFRGNLSISNGNYFSLDAANGMPNEMSSLKNMWDEGKMKIIHTVGYENHNLSHFKGGDIVDSANFNFENDENKSGWLGRFILDQDPDYLENLPPVPLAIKVNSGSTKTFYNPDQIDLAVNFRSLASLQNIAESGLVYDTTNLPDACYYGEQIEYLRHVLNVTYEYAPFINEAYADSQNAISYTNTTLGNSLALISRLIKGNLGTKMYMVTLNGFDTHDFQKQNHLNLLRELSDAVSEFYEDLAATNHDQDVLTMTVSEFGRRVNANTSQGTDHGTAAPMLMFGPGLNENGFVGDLPDMQDLDMNGNLKHSVDFRSVYASVLEKWMCLDPVGVDNILGDSYDRLALGFDCTSVGTFDVPLAQHVSHRARPDGRGGMIIEYTFDRPGNAKVDVYSMTGKHMANLADGYHTQGTHQKIFANGQLGLVPFPMVYKIQSGARSYSGKFIMGTQ